MKATSSFLSGAESLWATQDKLYRKPAELVGFGWHPNNSDPRLFEYEARGKWWDILGELEITLLITREYEHLLLALHVNGQSGPMITMLGLPHPSGVAVNLFKGVVHVAATRNPNQIIDLMPVHGLQSHSHATSDETMENRVLIPVRSQIFPGCLYIHDLAIINSELYANAVGQNAVVRFTESGRHERVWWPKCIEVGNGPIFEQNHLQLNSIAAGNNLENSFFSASTDEVSVIRPGDPTFQVDRRGVIFSGATREPIARGLTRPHSARLHENRVWVDNSGYGEVGHIEDGRFVSISKLSGWTRGLCFYKTVMFVGTSRVLKRFHYYAPGLDFETAECGIHAVDVASGHTLGSITWPFGSQVFSVEWLPASFSKGLPFKAHSAQDYAAGQALFYSFELAHSLEE